MKKILFMLILLPLLGRSQSIGVDFMFASKGSQQYGIVVESVVKCWGAYVNVLVKEDLKADITMCHGDVNNYHGIILGVTYETGWDIFPFVCGGIGQVKYQYYDDYKKIDVMKPLIEIRSAIRLSKLYKKLDWIDLEFGFNTDKQMNTGFRIKYIL